MRTPEQLIQDAHRIDLFLKDEAIIAAFSRMERAYYEEFANADSSEKRVTVWAKAKVLKDFEGQLKILVEPLEIEKIHAAKRTRAAERTPE